MSWRFFVWSAVFLLTAFACDSGEPPQPSIGERAAVKINDTAMNVYFVKIKSAAQKYRATRGSDPETVYDLVDARLLDAPSATDPWGNPWVLDTSSGQLTVTSYGSDGRPGGTEAARDRVSR